MLTIAIANHKGGVGKSATAHALGVALSTLHGRRVLLVDMDPQASLTGACGISDTENKSLAEVLGGASPGTRSLSSILRQLAPKLYLAPADVALAVTELGLTSRMGREGVLRKALSTVAMDFDVAIVDSPPSLGLLTLNALNAARAVLIPTQPQVVDLRGLKLFLDTIRQIRMELNPDLETLGILVTFYDRRLTHHNEAIETMKQAGLPVLPVTVGRSVRVAEAATSGESVLTYAPKNPQAEAYRALAEVVEAWRSEHA